VPYAVFFGFMPSPCRRCLWRRFLFASIASFVLFAAPGCEKHEAGQAGKEQRPVDVTVLTVTSGDVPVAFEYIAQVQSSRQVNIQARVSGFLDKRVYSEGAIVKEGQKLFIMDQKPFKVQLDQAAAALAKQEAALEVARLNLARVKPLAKANALSQKDLDDATGQFQSAAAAVDQAKASVEQAKLNLSYTIITSPVAGITSDAKQADGTYLSFTNSELTTVAVISPSYVNFSISENDWLGYRDEVAKGLLREPPDQNFSVEVVLADGSIYSHIGQLTFAAPSYNAQTGTFLIRVTIDNPDNVLRPNQYVRVRLKGAVRPNAILVPQRTVQQGAKGHFIWVVSKESKAEPRPVRVGAWLGNDVFIPEGLRAGDQVVVDGGLALRPGMAVAAKSLVPKTESAPAGAAPKTETGRGEGAKSENRGRD
jgi:membrane fusion protein, multidrug efflux system